MSLKKRAKHKVFYAGHKVILIIALSALVIIGVISTYHFVKAIVAQPAVCGNGFIEDPETCDDGNTVTEACAYGFQSCTVCDSTCQLTSGATSFCGDGLVNGSEQCDDGNTVTEACAYGLQSCTVCNAACQTVNGATSFCGDGLVNGTEQCDDGNTVPGDGCSATCQTEIPTPPSSVCGNSVVETGEQCDDGNTVTEACAYGLLSCTVCNSACQTVNGATSFCGDGLVNGTEQCDDGNIISGDGCSASCQTEIIHPAPVCGNSVVETGEQCDDGNTVTEACAYGLLSCTVCNSACQLTNGVTSFCGNGTVNGTEQCDDGNVKSGDGCSASCQTEKITVIANKIVCPKESDLPNWGKGGPDITSGTASSFLSSHPSCHLEPNWNFQWGNANVVSPGDNAGEASVSTGWHTFGPTDSSGKASVDVTDIKTGTIKVREVPQKGYVPFTFQYSNNTNINNVSAEIYCNTDVLNYDNFDYILNYVPGGTYYCVAFNAPLPVCNACQGKVNSLTIKYMGTKAVTLKITTDEKKSKTILEQKIQPNQEFTLNDVDKNGNNMNIYVNGSYYDNIYTSCSYQIGTNMKIGSSFLVSDGTSTNGGKFCEYKDSHDYR